MRRISLLLSVSCALVLAGCGQGGLGGGGGDKRLADIEKQVKDSQDQNRDLRTKMAAREALGDWGWNHFLHEPEFWQCTYDSGWSDCANRCTKQTSDGYKACMQKPEGPVRNACIQANAENGASCLKSCPAPSINEGVTHCSI